MIAFTAPLWLWNGEGGSWHFITVSEEASAATSQEAAAAGPRQGFGSVRVEARIGMVRWRTSVFPQKSSGYILPVKAEVRRNAGIATGDEVSVELELL